MRLFIAQAKLYEDPLPNSVMKKTITHRMVSKEWGRILTKPMDRQPRIFYRRRKRNQKDYQWMSEILRLMKDDKRRH